MRRKYSLGFIAFLVVMCMASISSAEIVSDVVDTVLPFDNLEMAGYFKNETAMRLSGGMEDFMKEKNIVDIKTNYRITDNVDFFAEFKWFYDSVYDIEDRYEALSFGDTNVKLRQPVKLQWLRECFLDVYTPQLDLRIGKQQVVWGTTDGVRILDMVCPLDYREWTIKDYSETRIPLWMLKVEGELMMNGHLQFLVIPDYEPNYYGPPGSPFTLRTVQIGDENIKALTEYGVNVATISEEPPRTFENTKYGLRWRNVVETGIASGLEYTVNYLNGYDFASSAYTVMQGVVIPGVGFVPTAFRLTRRAERINVIGGSFSKSITKGIMGDFGRGWTVRGELAHIRGGAMNYGTDTSIQGTVDVSQTNWALGFDKTFMTNWDFSLQYIQLVAEEDGESFDRDRYTLLFGPTRGPLDKVESIISMRLATDFMHERIQPSVLLLYTDDNDWRISPKVNFEVNDNWMFTTGIHIFEGTPQHLNGQFDKNDQIFFETTYSW
ncbi:DUF1302 family protein [Candidatus Omnitrophota bacterium]